VAKRNKFHHYRYREMNPGHLKTSKYFILSLNSRHSDYDGDIHQQYGKRPYNVHETNIQGTRD
jgi:hypothetical protein